MPPVDWIGDFKEGLVIFILPKQEKK
jgi:hypothetical protein